MSVENPIQFPKNWNTPLSPWWFAGSWAEDPYSVKVNQLLMEDRVEAAYELASKIGLGSRASYLGRLNLIAAERETRASGLRREVSPTLDFEYLHAELGPRIEAIILLSVKITEAEQARFGWDGNAKTLVTFLPKDFDAPWATARYGYCAPRDGSFKIGIPFHATMEPSGYTRVFTHEYAHVMSQSITEGRISTWVSEGFSVFASGDCSEQARRGFIRYPHLWRTPIDLGTLFGEGVDLGSQEKWAAYQQAGWITKYLASLKGDGSLLTFFRQFADESFFRNLKMLALSESPTDEALTAVYGFNSNRLFKDAFAALQSL